MKLLWLVASDVKEGLRYECPAVCLAVVVAILSCASLWSSDYEGIRSLGDYLTNMFLGMAPYTFDISSPFKLPVAWLLLLFSLLFDTLRYPYKDLYGTGAHVMMRSGSRLTWWWAKCLWVVLSVALLCCLLVLVAVLWTLATGGSLSLHTTESFLDYVAIYGDTAAHCEASVTYLASIFGWVLALSLIQLVLSIALKPAAGFVTMVSYLFFSSFYATPLLLGNYLMAHRNSVFGGTIDAMSGMPLSLAVCVFAIAVGAVLIQLMDVIERGED